MEDWECWLDRRTKSSQMRTAAVLVEGSEPFAYQSIRRNASQFHGALDKEGKLFFSRAVG